MSKGLDCLRCRVKMKYLGNKKLQLGQTGWLMGDLPNLMAGSLEVTIYICPSCGKLEFFRAEEPTETECIAQRKCPSCGETHDLDYPKCPYCKHPYI